jgi:hypothetical protein
MIPADMLNITFSFLTVGTLSRVGCTCRRWHTIAYQRHVWECISTRYLPSYQRLRLRAHDILNMVVRADHHLHTLCLDGIVLTGSHHNNNNNNASTSSSSATIIGSGSNNGVMTTSTTNIRNANSIEVGYDTRIMNALLASCSRRKRPLRLLSLRQCQIDDWSTLMSVISRLPVLSVITDVITFGPVSLSMATSPLALAYSQLEILCASRHTILDGGRMGYCQSSKHSRRSPSMMARELGHTHIKNNNNNKENGSTLMSSSTPMVMVRTCSICKITACRHCAVIVCCAHCSSPICSSCNGGARHCDNRACESGWQFDVCRSCTHREGTTFSMCVTCQQQHLIHCDGTPLLPSTAIMPVSLWCNTCARRCQRCDDTYCPRHATTMALNTPTSMIGVCQTCARVKIQPQSGTLSVTLTTIVVVIITMMHHYAALSYILLLL